jgi:rod shape-determining protein MreD
MTFTRVPGIVAVFGLLFLLQEALINRVSFLVGGFSLYLAFFIVWIMQEERGSAVATGFIAGFIADLSPTLEAPFGLWSFVFTVVAYLIANNVRAALDSDLSPITISVVAVFGSFVASVMFLVSGAILGQEVGSASYILRELFGNAVWTFLLSPLYAPISIKLYRATLTARNR